MTVIGGLITSALLTLLVIPVGYILFTKLDRLFGRVGPWLMVSWAAATLAVIVSLVLTGLLESWLWIVVCSALVGMFFLAIVVLAFRRVELPEPDMSNGPPSLEVSHLRKIYGLAGPIRTALNAHGQFSAAVLRAGGKVFSNTDAVERTFVFVILTLLMLTAAYVVDAGGWCLFFLLVASGLIVALLNEIRRLRGYVMDSGTLIPGRIEQIAAYVIPWLMIASFSYVMNILPLLQGEQQESLIFWPVLASVVVALMQILRRSAVRQIRGELSERATGFLRYPRTLLRKWARRVGGLDIPQDEVHALTALNFKAERGMIGILGPNGAGKTTLLRQLAGILEPTGGVIKIGGVPINLIRKYLANWIGYLPQDAGLPPAQSAKEYLLYYAALYDLPEDIRHERVDQLLDEVGLSDKAEDTIGSLSGGMRQRVAVARTLLRLPPIIIVDEPTVGLDPRERIRFRNLLSRLAQDRIVLFSTHVVDDVAVACDRVLVLAGSRLKFDDSPTNLATIAEGKVWETVDDINQPLRLPTDAFLAEESPTLDGHTRRRILSNIAPSKDATPLEPNPEDGYLWLIGASHA